MSFCSNTIFRMPRRNMISNIVRIQFPFHPEAMFPYEIDFRHAISQNNWHNGGKNAFRVIFLFHMSSVSAFFIRWKSARVSPAAPFFVVFATDAITHMRSYLICDITAAKPSRESLDKQANKRSRVSLSLFGSVTRIANKKPRITLCLALFFLSSPSLFLHTVLLLGKWASGGAILRPLKSDGGIGEFSSSFFSPQERD